MPMNPRPLMLGILAVSVLGLATPVVAGAVSDAVRFDLSFASNVLGAGAGTLPTNPNTNFFLRVRATRLAGMSATQGLGSANLYLFYNSAQCNLRVSPSKQLSSGSTNCTGVCGVAGPCFNHCGSYATRALGDPEDDTDDLDGSNQTNKRVSFLIAYNFNDPALNPNADGKGVVGADDGVVVIGFDTSPTFSGQPLFFGMRGAASGSGSSASTVPPGGDTLTPVNFGFSFAPNLLAVELADLRAEAAAPGQPVMISWTTAAEIDNAGFNVLRASEAASGNWISDAPVNDTFIASMGDATAGATYMLMDPTPLAVGEARGYFLEDVDIFGTRTLHGPVFASIQSNASVTEWGMFD